MNPATAKRISTYCLFGAIALDVEQTIEEES